ncbi:MAG: ATP-grasp domain-containing protein [Magnetovibrio sp.]|nr:ATP-grasp domain-containing protein [Magnetovibrio sp.]
MSDKRCLLIVGAGFEQIYAYNMAHKMGLEVVASDYDPQAPAFEYADYKLIASTRNPEETITAAKKFHQEQRPIDGVMTVANDVPLTVASVADALGLPGISIDAARIASDKFLMKREFEAAGVPVPRYEEIFSADDIRRLAKDGGLPLVIKPNDGRGARGVLRITQDIDFDWAFAYTKKTSESGQVLAEAFVNGPQLSSESMIYNGKCYTAAVSHRNYELLDTYAPYIIENGGVIPADLSEIDLKSIDRVIHDAAKAMGVERGTVKGDIVLSEDGPVVIELAARLSGGGLCTDQIPLSRGVDLVEQTIRLALGEELDVNDLIPQDLCKIGIRYIFPKPGVVQSVQGFDDLDKLEWISKKKLLVEVGDIIEDVVSHPSRVGFVHAVGQSYDEAEHRAISAVEQVVIKTA